MKKAKFICLVALFAVFSTNAFPQTDSLITNKDKFTAVYLGFGGGICIKGLGGEISGTFIAPNNWGGVLRFNDNAVRAKDLPQDYEAGLIDLFAINFPSDNFNIYSFNIVKEFPTHVPLVKFGVEAGPAIVVFKLAKFQRTDYTFFTSNYIVSHESSTSLGFSVRFNADFPLTRFAGLQTSIYTNINQYKSQLGMQFVLNFGMLRERIIR